MSIKAQLMSKILKELSLQRAIGLEYAADLLDGQFRDPLRKSITRAQARALANRFRKEAKRHRENAKLLEGRE